MTGHLSFRGTLPADSTFRRLQQVGPAVALATQTAA